MDTVREILAGSEPLLLFVVIGFGFLAGQIKIRGFSLGVAGVLFAGLLLGAWHPSGTSALSLAPQVTQVGLILFVYAVGLTSGSGFFESLRSQGLRFNVALVVSLLVGAVLTLWVGRGLDLTVGQVAGVYCGGLTNTPALAAVTELVSGGSVGDPRDPAIGYSLAYPWGVIGGLLAFQGFAWIFRRQAEAEREEAAQRAAQEEAPAVADFRVTNPELVGRAIGELAVETVTGLRISRHKRGEKLTVPTKYTVLQQGDLVAAVGTKDALTRGRTYFGELSDERLERAGEAVAARRILVSRKALAGQTIGSLGLDRRFNAQATRLRRADVDMRARPEMRLQLGDRLRVVMPLERQKEVTEFFGDSERAISELDYTALTLGIALGVLIGLLPIPLPGGSSVSLGFAGGPLVAGLVLGKLSRTGPLVWSIPLEANQALRHIGLLFFLAGVGVHAGGGFFEALSSNGLSLLLLGFLTTTLTTVLMLVLMRFFARASVVSAIGATSGMQTQPATLARAYEMSQSEETYTAYATTYPVAMVGKILIAQLLIVVGVALS